MLGSNVLAATSSSSGGFSGSTLILILIVVVAFYLLLIRPQQRRKQQAARQQNTITPGARVRTTAGMYATVVAVDGDDVVLEVAPGIEVRYMKRAIMDVVSPGTADDEEAVDEEAVDEEAVDDEAVEPGEESLAGREQQAPAATTVPDAESTAYEQATGTKQD